MNKISALRSGKFHSALVASALLALSSPLAAQTTYTWDNGTNTSVWGTSANWVGDPALTFNNQTAIIFNDASVVNDATAISIGGAKTINSLTINADFFTAATNGSSFDIRTRSTLSAGSAAANLTFDATAGNNASITVAQSTSGIGQVRLGDNGGGNVVLNTNLNLAQSNTFFTLAGFQFDGKITGVGTINKTGLGEVRLLRDNSGWSGGLNINEGNVTIAANPTAMGTGTWTLGGGTNNTSLSVASLITYTNAGGLVVAAGTGTRTIQNYNLANQGNPTFNVALTLDKDVVFAITNFTNGTVDRINFAGAIGGTGGIVKTGPGIAVLTASNSYSGTTDIQGGKFYLGVAGRLGSGAVTISNGANLDFGTGSGQTNTVSNNISGAGAIVQSTASTTTRLTGDVTSTGGLTINNGTLFIGDGGATGSYNGATVISNGATFAFGRSNNYTHSGTISGAGALSKTGAGDVTMTASNSYSGTTGLFAGALVAGHANALGTGNITFSALGGGGTLRYTAASAGTDWASRIVNSDAAIRLDTDGNNVNLAGVIASNNTGGLTKSGNGTLTLSGNNAFTGGTTIAAGVLQLNRSGGASLGTTASLTVASGATLLISQNEQINDSATVTLSGGTIQRGAGVSEVFGNLNLTAASFLDFGSGGAGTVSFGTYTPSALRALNILNFTQGNTLTFGSDLTTSIETSAFVFSGNGGLGSYSWDNDTSTFTITAIPEPSTYLAAAGLLAVLMWPSRRRLLKDAKSVLGFRRPMRDRLG